MKKTLLILAGLLAVQRPVLAAVENPAPPLSINQDGRRRQIQRELQEVEHNQAHLFTVYQDRQNDVRQAQQNFDQIRSRYRQAVRDNGRYSPEGAAMAEQLADAQRALYSRINARDHVHYQLEILNKGIQDRRNYLNLRQASAR